MGKELVKCKKCSTEYFRVFTGKINTNGAKNYVSPEGLRLRGSLCRKCFLDRNREYWSGNKDIWLSYERGLDGFLMRKYRNMLSRVRGVTKAKNHLYLGLEICPKKDFYDWSKNNLDFLRMFKDYTDSGYSRVLCPSVDRVNPLRGYTFDNMEWVTFSENCRRSRR